MIKGCVKKSYAEFSIEGQTSTVFNELLTLNFSVLKMLSSDKATIKELCQSMSELLNDETLIDNFEEANYILEEKNGTI